MSGFTEEESEFLRRHYQNKKKYALNPDGSIPEDGVARMKEAERQRWEGRRRKKTGISKPKPKRKKRSRGNQ